MYRIKSRLFRATMALLTLFVLTTSSVSAADNWSTMNRGWLKGYAGSPYTYYVPVCLGTSIGGPGWDSSNNLHGRILDAMTKWNNTGGELFYFTAVGSPYCDTDAKPKILIKFNASINELGFTEGGGTFCWEPWGASCSDTVTMTFNNGDNFAPGVTWYRKEWSPGSNQYDFYTSAVHEFGHASRCGGHSPDSGDVMYGYLATGATRRTPTQDDRDECYRRYYGSTH